MIAAFEEAIYYEDDDRMTQRALQDRLADIDFLTGWKIVLSGMMRSDCSVFRDATAPAWLVVLPKQTWK